MALALESKFSEAEARELTDELRSDYGSLQVKISTAWQGRIWLALGYDSWQDYLDNEFRDVSLRPPKDLEEQVISELRAAGMSTEGSHQRSILVTLRCTAVCGMQVFQMKHLRTRPAQVSQVIHLPFLPRSSVWTASLTSLNVPLPG